MPATASPLDLTHAAQLSAEKVFDSRAGVTRLVVKMTANELSALVALRQQASFKRRTQQLLSCRGEMEGQTGIIVYSFTDAASAAAFQVSRQIEARPLRLEILDRMPSEVREYVQ